MALKMQPTSVIKANLGIEPNGRVHKFFTATCRRYMDKYVPMDTGILAGNVTLTANSITYEQPYAHYQYMGISKSGKPLNYSPDKHPLAGSQWDKRMWTAEGQQVVQEVQNHFNKGGN